MNKSEFFKRHVLEQLYGKPEPDSDHDSEDESCYKPGLEETSVPPVSGRKVYGAALPPNWPQDSSGQDVNGKQQSHTTADHSSSHSGSSSSSDSEEEECHKRRKRKRRRHHAGNAQTSEQDPSRRNAESEGSHKQINSSNCQTQLSKNQKRKLKKKRREKRRKEEERRQQQTDSSPQQTLQPGTFVYEGSARSALEQEENKRREDLLQRLKDVTSFLDAVVDVYNRDLALQDKVVETWSGTGSQALHIAVLSCEDSLREVQLLCRAKSTALLGHPDLASEARLQLCQQSSLPADLIKFVSTMMEYWITDVMKKA